MNKLAPHMLYPCSFCRKIEIYLVLKGSTPANVQSKQGEALFYRCRYPHVTVEQLE